MAKYIDVKIVLEKTMKIDTDNLDEALKIAEEEYPDLELTPEWLDARDVSISENPIIEVCANRLADLSYNNFDKKLIDESLDIMFGDSEIKDYVYNEALDILKEKYHLDFSDISIQEEQFIFEEIKKEYDDNFNKELNKTGVFWAFGNDQFDENKTHKDAPDNEYISVGAGGYIHKSNKEKLDNFLKNTAPKLKKDFVSRINIDDLIRYELNNHECYYTGDFSKVINIIHSYYDMPIDEIYDKVKNIYYQKNNEKNDLDDGHIGIQEEYLIIEEKLKKINDLGFEFRKTKDDAEKERIEDELKNIIYELKQEAIKKFSSESDIKKFLDNLVNFNNYSFNNQLLIWLQDPTAQYVASKTTFNKMGYNVNKGDYDGIKVYMPQFYNIAKIIADDESVSYKPYFALTNEEKQMYKDKTNNRVVFHKQKLSGFGLGNVFSVTDTNMPMDAIEEELNPVLEDPSADGVADTFIKAIYKDGFKVKYEDIKDGAKGYCDFETNTIAIRKGLSNLMRLKVIVHEYAHGLAHQHLKNNNIEYEEHRNQYETEAESIAYVVSKYLGLDTGGYSMNYLYSWSKEKDFKEIEDSLSMIVNNSKKIISNYKKMYDENLGLWADVYQELKV